MHYKENIALFIIICKVLYFNHFGTIEHTSSLSLFVIIKVMCVFVKNKKLNKFKNTISLGRSNHDTILVHFLSHVYFTKLRPHCAYNLYFLLFKINIVGSGRIEQKRKKEKELMILGVKRVEMGG